ncbi:c-type cytochrome [Planococcus lenghuensis]|uniref:Cytochrome C n=1 Tax=Planococcus lenghuensis TaxID=2213202 RepID=A0A1Q2L567_9BACL|nr:cytochrome c [Planococcus lenghuensis]AQQ55042.1 cytochrome C [Planococcus lenghuensis]
MAFGIGLIFFLSLEGNSNQEEIAAEEEGGEEVVEEGEGAGEGEGAAAGDFDPVAVYEANCASCHGANFEGGVGPNLITTELPPEEIAQVLAEGRGIMPGGLVPEEHIDAMATWITELE